MAKVPLVSGAALERALRELGLTGRELKALTPDLRTTLAEAMRAGSEGKVTGDPSVGSGVAGGQFWEPAPTVPLSSHARSGVFDYSAEYPERDLGIQRYQPPRGVPQRTIDLLARPEVQEGVASGIERGMQMGADDWYWTAPIRKSFQDEFGHNRGLERFDKFIDANAATSPRSDVGTNIRNASFWFNEAVPQPGQNYFKTADELIETPPYPYGHLAQKLHRMNIGKTLSQGGPGYNFKDNAKPIAYGGALKGDLSKVAVDTHAFRAPAMYGADPNFLETSFKPEKESVPRNIMQEVARGEITMQEALERAAYWASKPRPTEYGAFEDLYSNLGNDYGLRPAQAQSAGWAGSGRLTGLESDEAKRFMDFMEERILLTAGKTGQDPKDVWKRAMWGEGSLLGLGGAAVAGDQFLPGGDRRQ